MLDRLDVLIHDNMHIFASNFRKSDAEIVHKYIKASTHGSIMEMGERVTNMNNMFRDMTRDISQKVIRFAADEGIKVKDAAELFKKHLENQADDCVRMVGRVYLDDNFNRNGRTEDNKETFKKFRREMSKFIEFSADDIEIGRSGWERVKQNDIPIINRIVGDIKKDPWKILSPVIAFVLGWIGKAISG